MSRETECLTKMIVKVELGFVFFGFSCFCFLFVVLLLFFPSLYFLFSSSSFVVDEGEDFMRKM